MYYWMYWLRYLRILYFISFVFDEAHFFVVLTLHTHHSPQHKIENKNCGIVYAVSNIISILFDTFIRCVATRSFQIDICCDQWFQVTYPFLHTHARTLTYTSVCYACMMNW